MPSASSGRPPAHYSTTPPRIVVAEDHPVCSMVMQDQLATLGLFDVEMCASGRGAWHAWQYEPARLVITDLNLPDMDGLTLARAIRATELVSGHRTAIVIVTATITPTLRTHCEQVGVDLLLEKPIGRDLLKSLLDRYL